MNTRNTEQHDHKLWIVGNWSGVFEVNKILLNCRYTALSCEENVLPEIRILKVTGFVVLICGQYVSVRFCLARVISAGSFQNLNKLKTQSTLVVSWKSNLHYIAHEYNAPVVKNFFANVLRDSGGEGGRVIILYPFCTLFCYLLFAAPSNAYQRPDKNCQWFCCFTDNSSVFVQGDLTHQGSLLCCCCKALKRLCLCCKALKGEPLNPYK